MTRTSMYLTAVGLVLLAGGVLLFLSVASHSTSDPPNPDYPATGTEITNLCGVVGAYAAYGAKALLGTGGYVLALALVAIGALVVIGRPVEDPIVRGIGALLFLVSWCTVFDLFLRTGGAPGGYGGLVGRMVSDHLLALLGTGKYVVALLGLALGALLAADVWVFWMGRKGIEVLTVHGRGHTAAAARTPEPSAEDPLAEQKKRLRKRLKAQETDSRKSVQPETEERTEVIDAVPAGRTPSRTPESLTLLKDDARRPPSSRAANRKAQAPGEYQLPGIGLLDTVPPSERQPHDEALEQKREVVERTLEEFGIAAQVVEIDRGPVITQFELELAPGIKIGKIVGLSDDIARALKAPSVRVVAPIPGKSTVGVEVPNSFRETVRLRQLFESGVLDRKRMTLPILLGDDAGGQPLVADLAQMPHLLIAGATGSGKSVCMNSIIMTFLMTQYPEEVKLLLVDPKMVELSVFRDIPHLMAPVLTDMKKAAAVLEWATRKMDERYSLLANVGARNIAAFNALGEEGVRKRLGVEPDENLEGIQFHMPYMIIIVDELADLMLVSPRDVENTITRLAQKSRAVGIHLIMATQRPSVDVVTGLIKANLPSRVAFQTASKVDSRTILDRNGAEKLLGRGDMLFLPPGSSQLIRAQGTFTSDDEIRRVTAFLREQRRPMFHPELVRQRGLGEAAPDERDDLYGDAVRIILESQRGSVSLLQRKLGVGYSRAARLIDMMAEAGIVGDYKGSQAREVLYTLEEWDAQGADEER